LLFRPNAVCLLCARSDRYKDALDEFFLPTGPVKLVFFFQVRQRQPASRQAGAMRVRRARRVARTR
jgi:hypothetical protein